MYISIVVEGGTNFYRMKIPDKEEFFWVRDRQLAHGYSTPVEAIIAGIDSLPECMKNNVNFEEI